VIHGQLDLCSERWMALSPDRCIERVRELHRALADSNEAWEIELYHRLAQTMRLRESVGTRVAELLVGQEDGVAMRARSKRDGRRSFAACSGLDAAFLRRELDSAGREVGGPAVGEGELWPRSTAGLSVDREGPLDLPEPTDLRAWLEQAREAMQEPRGRRRVPPPADCRVEVAVIVETWVAEGVAIGSRARRRAWGMARPATDADDVAQRPLVIAARRWDELPVRGWRTILDDRWIGSARGEAASSLGRVPVLFNPECAAVLGRALIRALHGSDPGPPPSIATAWKVIDDPTDSQALFGGRFDDAGFPTAQKPLWHRGRAAGRLDGAGHFRRPSFRDPPGPLPSQLVFDVRSGSLPPRVLLVTRLSLHPLAPDRWGLEVDGAILDQGQPGSRVRGAFVSTSPRELAECCVASIGPPRDSHLGVRTAALLFDGLDVR